MNEHLEATSWSTSFLRACEVDGISPDHHESLARLVQLKISNGQQPFADVWQEILADYRDWELFCRASDGDEAAQESFYLGWRKRAMAYYRRKGFPSETCEDMFQHFCERLLRYDVRQRFAWKSLFRAYCYTTLQKIGIDQLRKQSRQPQPDVSDLPPPSNLAPDRSVLIKEQFGIFREAFDQLPDIDRRIFMKFYVDGEKAAQIGEALGLKPNAVQQRISRVRKKMRQALSGSGVAPVIRKQDDKKKSRGKT